MKVLIVDDDSASRLVLVDVVREWGYDVKEVSNGEDAIASVKSDPPDLILLDILMPGMDGYEVCRLLKKDSEISKIPILFLTAMDEVNNKTKGFEIGAVDYITKPFEILEVKARIETHLNLRKARQDLEEQNLNLEKRVSERTKEIQQLNAELKQSLLDSVRTLASLLEGFDSFLGGHSKRVTFYAMELGRELKMSEEEFFDLEISALLHDIGTISIPEKLISSRFVELSKEEQDLIKQHPAFAQSVLNSSAGLKKAGVMVRHHLEKWDGTGFPDGLQKTDIPLGSQIIGIANAYDELKMRRRFTKEKFLSEKMKEDFARHSLQKISGKHFDSNLVAKFYESLDEILKRKHYEKRINIEELREGMVLFSDLYTDKGKVLLQKGSQINSQMVEKLKAFHKAKLIGDTLCINKLYK